MYYMYICIPTLNINKLCYKALFILKVERFILHYLFLTFILAINYKVIVTKIFGLIILIIYY